MIMPMVTVSGWVMVALVNGLLIIGLGVGMVLGVILERGAKGC